MKTNELRQGNFIRFVDTDERVIVKGIDSDSLGIVCDFKNEGELWIEADKYSAVEITKDILDEFGLTDKYTVDAVYLLKDWGVYYSLFNKGIRVIDKGWITDVKYVHQLQNFFYFLTGTELTKVE